MIDQELTIESLRDDLKQLINARFIENKPRRSHIPNGLRASYRDRFFESHPVITQCWLIFSSNLNDTDQAKLALKLLMYRDLDPLEWIKSWTEDGSSEVLSTATDTSEGMHQFIDQAVEPPFLSEVKERQHVKWLLRTVTSHEGRIVKRLNKLWTHLDMLKVARAAKSVWMPLLQYTLKWRSDHEWARPNGEEALLDTLQDQIDQLVVCAAFEDFESFVEILSERYRGVGVSKKRSKKGPAMDDRMRILRRVQFWSNYRDQTSLTRFIISPSDHEAYHRISLEELMLGDESIIACEGLPSDSPLMVLRV